MAFDIQNLVAWRPLAALGLAALMGCLPSTRQPLSVSDVLETYRSAHPVGNEPGPARTDDAAAAYAALPMTRPAAQDIPADADAEYFVGLAIRRNPRLRAVRDDVLAKRARDAPVVGSRKPAPRCHVSSRLTIVSRLSRPSE